MDRWAGLPAYIVDCSAAAVILALAPLAEAGLLETATVEIKHGSLEGGSRASNASHHPERSGAVRVYRPSGHRHLAEVEQELGSILVHLTVTAIEMVRGIHLTAHCFLRSGSELREEKDVWGLHREAYSEEPFVRLVASRTGLYRYPEPKLGFGLWWVKTLMTRLGGSVTVESTPGQGTAFRLKLPHVSEPSDWDIKDR